MGKQSHDPGVRKRRREERRKHQQTRAETTEALARDLVRRKLCSPRIIGSTRKPIP